VILPSSLRSVPIALAYWLGTAGADEAPRSRIVLFHGTPRRDAGILERQLRWLKRRFDIVPLRSLVAAAAAGEPLGRRVALTFDDGLRSNAEVAYPLLHRLAIPATFYVCPGLVDCDGWLWNHEARRRLARLGAPQRQALAAEWHAPAEVDAFVEWMKTLELSERRRVETRLREATPRFTVTPEEREDCDLAGWATLRRLDPALVTIGSHSMTHAILTKLPAGKLETEVGESRRVLESRLQRPVDLFAYPNGDYDAAVEACVRQHYRSAVTAARGRLGRGEDAHRLARLAAPRGALRLARRIYC
jgi:peptidoglycan/xylan/chitin deacetylase (PgdA/CDA1 family)